MHNKLAVLIDAENTSPNLLSPLLKEIAKYGVVHVKRIYGDWTKSHLTTWKEKINKTGIQPIQQFAYTTSKNAIDIALVIDAMDLLHTEKFDGFCIVSSDSDFTRLAIRIRESGLTVYGFGKKQTPIAFVSSCDEFINTDDFELGNAELASAKTAFNVSSKSVNLANPEPIAKKSNGNQKALSVSSNPTPKSNAKSVHSQKISNESLKLIKDSYEAIAKENDWVQLSRLSLQLKKLSPSFQIKQCGYGSLSALIKASNLFETKAANGKTPFQVKLKGMQKKSISHEVIQFLQSTYEGLSNEHDWIDIGIFGKEIKRLSPSFSSKNYGCRTLSLLIKASNLFEKQNTKIKLKEKK